MGLTITEKIIKEHLVSGEMKKGCEIGIKIDQTLNTRFNRYNGIFTI